MMSSGNSIFSYAQVRMCFYGPLVLSVVLARVHVEVSQEAETY